ncbi:MAG: YCF48-related protein [Candidatus Sulfotelmatobacter sp.]
MENVPKFVVKRLQEATPVGEHPDADLLTAFAERSLAGRERESVMEHLALCGDCRDVFALAWPENEIAVVPASAGESSVAWLRWPGLRWGAVAAGVLAVMLVGVLQYSHQNQRKMVASNTVNSNIAPAVLSEPTSTQGAAQVKRKKRVLDSLGRETLTGRATDVRQGRRDEAKKVVRYGGGSGGGMGVASGSAGGIGKAGGRFAMKRNAFVPGAEDTGQAQNGAPVPRQQVVAGATSEPVQVQPAKGGVNADSARVESNVVAQNQPELALQSRNSADLDVVKAKNPVVGQASGAPTPRFAAPGPLQNSAALMVRELPQWTVSASGGLQRSFDGGNTWEDVNPALRGTAGGSFAKDAGLSQAEQNRKGSAAASPAVVFRAVSASGLEVWTGGSGGALYHTVDGGNNWTRVTPSSEGAGLTGDVISIEFSDPRHGKVSTSNAETWTTSDAGQSWRRQR